MSGLRKSKENKITGLWYFVRSFIFLGVYKKIIRSRYFAYIQVFVRYKAFVAIKLHKTDIPNQRVHKCYWVWIITKSIFGRNLLACKIHCLRLATTRAINGIGIARPLLPRRKIFWLYKRSSGKKTGFMVYAF